MTEKCTLYKHLAVPAVMFSKQNIYPVNKNLSHFSGYIGSLDFCNSDTVLWLELRTFWSHIQQHCFVSWVLQWLFNRYHLLYQHFWQLTTCKERSKKAQGC